MAAFFGEVIPVVSRAVDEDDEDDGLVYATVPDVDVTWNKVLPECSELIIAYGPAACVFIESNFLTEGNSEIIGELSLKSQKKSFIHQLKEYPGYVMCLCKLSLQPEQSFTLTEQILSHFKTTDLHVTILNTVMVAEYKCNRSITDIQLPLVKSLKTNSCDRKTPCPYLDQPNTVSGFPAQVLTYCEIYKLKGALYQSYTDSIHLDSLQVHAFNTLLNTLPFSKLKQHGTDRKKLIELINQESSDNLLYL